MIKPQKKGVSDLDSEVQKLALSLCENSSDVA